MLIFYSKKNKISLVLQDFYQIFQNFNERWTYWYCSESIPYVYNIDITFSGSKRPKILMKCANKAIFKRFSIIVFIVSQSKVLVQKSMILHFVRTSEYIFLRAINKVFWVQNQAKDFSQMIKQSNFLNKSLSFFYCIILKKF